MRPVLIPQAAASLRRWGGTVRAGAEHVGSQCPLWANSGHFDDVGPRSSIRVFCSIACFGEVALDDLMVIARQLRRPQLEGQLVELSCETEGHLVILVVHGGAKATEAATQGGEHSFRAALRDLHVRSDGVRR